MTDTLTRVHTKFDAAAVRQSGFVTSQPVDDVETAAKTDAKVVAPLAQAFLRPL